MTITTRARLSCRHAPPLAAVLLQGAMPGAIVPTHRFENGKGPGKMMEQM